MEWPRRLLGIPAPAHLPGLTSSPFPCSKFLPVSVSLSSCKDPILGLTLRLLLTPDPLPELSSSLSSPPHPPHLLLQDSAHLHGLVRGSSVLSEHLGHGTGLCLGVGTSVGIACLGIVCIPRPQHRPIQSESLTVGWYIYIVT